METILRIRCVSIARPWIALVRNRRKDDVTVLGVVQGKLATLGASGALGQRLRAVKIRRPRERTVLCMVMPALRVIIDRRVIESQRFSMIVPTETIGSRTHASTRAGTTRKVCARHGCRPRCRANFADRKPPSQSVRAASM